MNRFARAIPAYGALIAVCSFAGLFAGPMAGAAETADLDKSCRQETWRVTVVTKGGNPKQGPLPRYQKRNVLICDEKVFAEIQRQASSEMRTSEGS